GLLQIRYYVPRIPEFFSHLLSVHDWLDLNETIMDFKLSFTTGFRRHNRVWDQPSSPNWLCREFPRESSYMRILGKRPLIAFNQLL
ncbi:MAG: hypothetical protein KAX20_07790, partial [Candidatus Omnitrophica bacterium]|nr:hypothetical protein [Candidatus Omnitrophota bacterium]